MMACFAVYIIEQLKLYFSARVTERLDLQLRKHHIQKLVVIGLITKTCIGTPAAPPSSARNPIDGAFPFFTSPTFLV